VPGAFMKNHLRFISRGISFHCLAIGVALLCVSCASNRQAASVTPVAVIPANSDGSDLDTHGYLVVNTPMETHYDERSIRRFPHTGYSIYETRTHRLYKYVPNHLGQAGENAALVLLPAGDYMVEARTIYHRPIRFPVIIRPDTQTTVNLDADSPLPKTVHGELYTIQYHGRMVGWLTEAKAM
jgi:hypothetical protein